MSRPVVVVGAGLAGVTAARGLVEAGLRVVVLEKSRGFGGRMATRRAPESIGGAWDHGAAFLRVREPGFAALLRPLVDTRQLEPWAERLARPSPSGPKLEPLTDAVRRLAAPAGFSSIVRELARGLDVRRESKVVALAPIDGGWSVSVAGPDDSAAPLEARAVLFAIPAPQVVPLVRSVPGVDGLRSALEAVRFDPCLVGLFAFEGEMPAFRAIEPAEGPASWIGVESSKRPSSQVLVAVHGSPTWSQAHYESPEADVLSSLAAAAREAGIPLPERPGHAELKRWRYARPSLLAAAHVLIDGPESTPLAACGDWCVAPRIEGAYVSGRAAAERLVQRLA